MIDAREMYIASSIATTVASVKEVPGTLSIPNTHVVDSMLIQYPVGIYTNSQIPTEHLNQHWIYIDSVFCQRCAPAEIGMRQTAQLKSLSLEEVAGSIGLSNNTLNLGSISVWPTL